jgi:hypothetical protein
MTKVSVIIVNYNGDGLIKGCLKALDGQSFRDFEVVIVDNGSSDRSLDEIRDFLQGSSIASIAKVIALDRNLGFAGGNAEGLRYARCEYIALLNNDTEPNEKWLEELVGAMDSDTKVGICASKLIVHGTNHIDSAGDIFSTVLKGFKRGEGEKAFLYNEGGYVFGACAGAALYRRRMIDEVGFFDEDFFLIHEDTDLNLRAQLNGWKVFYAPGAIVYHKVRSTIGQSSDMAVYHSLRNSEFVRMKNIPIGVFTKCLFAFIIGELSEFIFFAIKHKKFVLFFKAKVDALRGLHRMLGKRARIMKNKKTDSIYLLSMMTPWRQRQFLKRIITKFFHE